MLMYTSCGWFFDEISGLETVQVMKYAARSIQLAKDLTGEDFEPEFVELLKQAPSNIPEVENGARTYEMYVKPAIVDIHRVAAHYAISTLFEDYSDKSKIYCYEVYNDVFKKFEAGKRKLVIGKSRMHSHITQEEQPVSFSVLHLGDHNINGGVRESINEEAFNQMLTEMSDAFKRLNIAEIILLLDKHFGTHNYTLWHLFKDETRKFFDLILEQTLDDAEISFRHIYENHYPIIQAMIETSVPLPKAISTAIEFVLNMDLRKILESEDSIDPEHVNRLFQEIKRLNVNLDRATLGYVGSNRINRLMEILLTQPENLNLMNDIETSLDTLLKLKLELNIWKAQNILFMISKNSFANKKAQANNGNKKAIRWIELFQNLENFLKVRIED